MAEHGFTLNPAKVRGDVFKASTKWKATLELDMGGLYSETLIHQSIALAWERFGINPDETLVVLEPFHQTAYPIMMTTKQAHYHLEDLRINRGEAWVTAMLRRL